MQRWRWEEEFIEEREEKLNIMYTDYWTFIWTMMYVSQYVTMYVWLNYLVIFKFLFYKFQGKDNI